MYCQLCEIPTNKLIPLVYAHDKLMVCEECFEAELYRADMEYERQREEGITTEGGA